MQLQQSSDLSSHRLVPRPSHRPVFVLLQYAYCELSKTGDYKRQEGLGTRVTSQIPPKGVYSKHRARVWLQAKPFGGGCGLGTTKINQLTICKNGNNCYIP